MTLANRIARSLSAKLGYDDERCRVIAYGLGAAIQMLELLFISVVFGLVFGCLIECMILFFGVGLLRRTAGGMHCNTYLACIVASSLSVCLLSLFCRYAVPFWLNKWWYIGFGLVPGFACACLLGWKRVPQASANKPISSSAKNLRLRKQYYLTLCVYLAFAVWLLAADWNGRRNINVFCAVVTSVLWQCFTLTEWSRRLACFFDSVFSGGMKDLDKA